LIVVLSATAAVLYRAAARALLPSIATLDLYGNMLKLVLYPIAALRCTETISYHLLAGYDPIAVIAGLAGKDVAARLAIRELVRLRYISTPATFDEQMAAAISEYKQTRIDMIESFCSEHDIPIAGWQLAPSADDMECITYCPCCRAQYRIAEGTCVDCRNVMLQPLRKAVAGDSGQRWASR
jgi:hypothetical protein